MNFPASTPVDAAFLAAQKTRLEEQKASLEAELSRIAKKDPVGDDYHAQVEHVGRAEDENAIEETQYESARSVEQSLELQLRDVNAALRRVADGTYGACTVCGSPIGRGRLEALPSAATCLQHAE